MDSIRSSLRPNLTCDGVTTICIRLAPRISPLTLGTRVRQPSIVTSAQVLLPNTSNTIGTWQAPAVSLLGKDVPRHLANRGVLGAGAGEVDKDQLFSLPAGLVPEHNVPDLRVHVFFRHDAGLDGGPKLAHLPALAYKVADHLAGLLHFGRDLVLRRLVRAACDDRRVGSQPVQLKNRLAAGGLGEDDVGSAHRLLGRGTHVHFVPKLRLELVGEILRLLRVETEREAFVKLVHARRCTGHGRGDDARADEPDLLVMGSDEVLDRHSAGRTRPQVREVAVFLEDSERCSIRCVADNEDARPWRQALSLVFRGVPQMAWLARHKKKNMTQPFVGSIIGVTCDGARRQSRLETRGNL